MPRSRGGCATCKKRHRKCDETRPSCIECLTQNLVCEGYGIVLRWGNGIASRGRFTGAIVPVENSPKIAPPRPSQAHPHSLVMSHEVVMIDTIHGEADVPGESRQAHTQGHGSDYSHMQISCSPSALLDNQSTQGESDDRDSSDSTGANLDAQKEQDDMLLNEHFETTIFQMYSTRDDEKLQLYLRQLAQESETLTAILIALHLYLKDPTTLSELFEQYYTRGLRSFRRQLELSRGVPKASVICAGLFICTLNLFQGIPWTVHLEHMVKLYHLSSDSNIDNPLFSEDAVEWIAMMDLPTFVQGRPTSSLQIWSSQRRAQESTPDGKRGGIEIISGLPRSLLDIFACIGTEAAETAFLNWPGELGEIPHCHLWEAYRIAGILMGRRWRRIRLRGPSLASGSPAAEVLLNKLIASLDALCDTRFRSEYRHSLAINSLLYPYATARLEVAILRQHADWIRTLRRIADICKPYGETANARLVYEMLEEALENGDDNYDIDREAKRRNVEISLF